MVVAAGTGHLGHQNTAPIAIIGDVTEDSFNNGDDRIGAGRDAGRLAEARRLLEKMKSAEGADALEPAQRLADLLEELLEEREGDSG